jgi:hypothetical protein
LEGPSLNFKVIPPLTPKPPAGLNFTALIVGADNKEGIASSPSGNGETAVQNLYVLGDCA